MIRPSAVGPWRGMSGASQAAHTSLFDGSKRSPLEILDQVVAERRFATVRSWISIGVCVTSDGWFTPLRIAGDNENLSRAKRDELILRGAGGPV